MSRETISPSHERLAGWIRARLRSAPSRIWLEVDVVEFVQFVGLSERTGRYALERLRSEAEDRGLKFRTVFDREHGAKGAWRVLVSEERRLDYDREPLFRDRGGRSRHLRDKMTGEELRPGKQAHRIDAGEPEGGWQGDHSGAAVEAAGARSEARSPCNSYKGGFPTETQQQNKHAGNGGSSVEARRWRPGRDLSAVGRSRLRAKAGAMTRRLGALWWDNVKVRGPADLATRQALAGWVFRHLRAGRTEAAIRSALDKALHRLHGTATDRGEVFAISSTLARADAILQRDERTVEERVGEFYRERGARWAEYRRLRTRSQAEALDKALHGGGVPASTASGRDLAAVEGGGDICTAESGGEHIGNQGLQIGGGFVGGRFVFLGELGTVSAQDGSASFGGGESSLCAFADAASFILSDCGEDLHREAVSGRIVHREKLHAGFHEAGKEMDVTGEAVEFRNDQRCLGLFRGGDGGGELGAV